ncbi:MAG: YihY/virulence factor BrkB family protein [Halomonas sp.]|uniref:YihY/virulence factor BrkB family protein n=1 Tax=Halomonas sp. TaxID=1486246 RepID=UPI0028702D87|nr:YihY/virulence factor BrkB family protein [Halomonas sp.]MDR9439576.1 YihY/virulence factor BrkB family protein [Halomonas sp.]
MVIRSILRRLPQALRGWVLMAWRVRRAVVAYRVTMLAAGVAFYAMLALFPAIAAIISLWALVLDPQDMARQIGEVSRLMPPGAARLVQDQAREIGEHTQAGLSATALGGLSIAIFVASKGVRGLLVGLAVVHGETERRALWQRSVMILALTLGLVVTTQVAIAFVALFPLAIEMMGLEGPLFTLIGLLRWPLLLLAMMVVIAVFYRFGPYRQTPRWEWIRVGTLGATLLWLLGSGGLSLYARHVANLGQLYGSLGAVVVLMLWFWLSAFVVLLGALINVQMGRSPLADAEAPTS